MTQPFLDKSEIKSLRLFNLKMKKIFNRAKGRKGRYLAYLVPTFFVILVFVLTKFMLFICYVPSASMEPTIRKNSLIVGIRIFKDIQVGDVVVFIKDGQYLVKRVAATENTDVEIEGKKYSVPNDEVFLLGDNTEKSYDSRFWTEPFVKTGDIVAKIILY